MPPQSINSHKLSVLMVGPSDEVAPAGWAGLTDRLAESARLQCAADLPAASAQLADERNAFDLVVLCESRPGQYSAAEIDALRHQAPLARFWRLLGSWCEGEQRSATPPPGCAHTYWHQWPPRVARHFAATVQGNCPAWGWPLTATTDELALVDFGMPIEPRSGRVVICADRAEAAAALADACRLAGYETMLMSEAQIDRNSPTTDPATAILWDTSADRATDPGLVEQVRRAGGGGPVLAVVGFPRPDDERRAREAGVAAVVSKPYLVRDLLWQLARVADSPG